KEQRHQDEPSNTSAHDIRPEGPHSPPLRIKNMQLAVTPAHDIYQEAAGSLPSRNKNQEPAKTLYHYNHQEAERPTSSSGRDAQPAITANRHKRREVPHSRCLTSTYEQKQWTTSTTEELDSGWRTIGSESSESTPYVPHYQSNLPSPNSSRVTFINDDIESVNLSKASFHTHRQYPSLDHNDPHSSGFQNIFTSTAGSQTPPIIIPTGVVRVERPTSSTRSNQFLQRMDSAVQPFDQYIREGQLMQAKVIQQEAESIKKDMTQYHGSLQTEVAKNTILQNQVKEMVKASERMTKRILELQEVQMDNNRQMMAKLALIHSKATAILTQTYELHEFPIPRLFINLPVGDITNSLSHDIHFARHEGYNLDRPNEFFRKYGSYVLALLQMLKYGVIAAGMVVPPLYALKVADGLAVAEARLKVLEEDFALRVDSAIKYLQGLNAAQESESKDLGNSSSTAS
ncbi:hypothetical protein BGX24_002956, partial [Mortierella sp. AD032]